VALYPELEPLLDRVARALVAHEQSSDALAAAAQRLSATPASASVVRAMARCEVLERRARLHVELSRSALAARRAAILADQRRVPAAFRRRHQHGNGTGPPVEVKGSPADRSESPVIHPMATRSDR
jgi:hypothetical protein